MDQETWRFINTFAPWLSAIGTLTAVAVSLYLARRSDRQKLEVRVGLRNVAVLTDRPLSSKPFMFLSVNVISNVPPALVVVTVTNVGRRPVKLASMSWQAGRGRHFLWTTMNNEYSYKFPITLGDGEPAFYSWPVAGLKKNFTESFGDEFAGFRGAIRLRRLRLCVSTSTGDMFRQKPEKGVLELFKELANEKKPA